MRVHCVIVRNKSPAMTLESTKRAEEQAVHMNGNGSVVEAFIDGLSERECNLVARRGRQKSYGQYIQFSHCILLMVYMNYTHGVNELRLIMFSQRTSYLLAQDLLLFTIFE